MYLDHYNINENPFQNDVDKKYFWFGDSLSNVASSLKNEIIAGKGIILLSGDAGSGKTTLANWIADVLENQFVIAKIYDSYFDCLEFFNFLSDRFHINKKFENKSTFLLHFRNFLLKTYSNQEKILLIFDEIHNLKPDLLNELSLLTEIRMHNQKMISILLTGQKKRLNILKEEEINKLVKNVAVNFELGPLSENETFEYVGHHLKIAGAQNEIFSKEALQKIFSFSQGNLRMINIICDHALKTGYTNNKKSIDAEVIKECRKDLSLTVKTENRNSLLKNLIAMIEKQKTIFHTLNYYSAKRFWLLILLSLIGIFCVYFLYNFKMSNTPRWGIEDIVPLKNDFQALKEKKSLIQKFEKNKQTVKLKEEKEINSSKENQETASISKNETQSSKSAVEKKAQDLSSLESTAKIKKFAITSYEHHFIDKKIIIYFKHNSNELSNESFELLDRIAEIMPLYPEKAIEIRGYTDSSGEYGYNLIISKYRADSVKSYLAAKGISPTKMKSFGMGPHEPRYSNNTSEGRKLNRRVEIEFLSGGQ